jgi:hypothetical protein
MQRLTWVWHYSVWLLLACRHDSGTLLLLLIETMLDGLHQRVMLMLQQHQHQHLAGLAAVLAAPTEEGTAMGSAGAMQVLLWWASSCRWK